MEEIDNKEENEETEVDESQKKIGEKKDEISEHIEEKPEQNNEPNLEKDKEGKLLSLVRGTNKKGSFVPIIIVMVISLAMAAYWDNIAVIKNTVHAILDPSAGALLNWDLTIGMLIIVFIITLITTIIQKYTTDQKELKKLRDEQKTLQKEMQKYKDNPAKLTELQKKSFEFIPKTFKLTSRAMLFTGIPFILLFRWFYDTFNAISVANNGVDPVFLGFLPWFWFYLISAMVFSGFLRKWMKVV